MGRSLKPQTLYTILLILVSIQGQALCSIHKVGDLHAWGPPTSANQQIYNIWSKYHNLRIGDSLFFLYPPSQDSVIQVSREAYNVCNLKDPILYMNNGNSLFNITRPGDYYFTSGVESHCLKSQKLHISVNGINGSFAGGDSPAYGPSAAAAPSYPTVFGSIPVTASQSSRSPEVNIPGFFLFAAAAVTHIPVDEGQPQTHTTSPTGCTKMTVNKCPQPSPSTKLDSQPPEHPILPLHHHCRALANNTSHMTEHQAFSALTTKRRGERDK
ncbi:early nodulin-like protein 8 [Striga hermonthica]|uniref:Early nodulin-like protein 8 n=1 Tax=Striga hermonthica TaxID=68872 RepID=A0A9N7RAW0_STRHE|nr:early nodulin-like protein 8 [Striga hermonthica]